MYVTDLLSPEMNIAVEVTEEEANNFKEMCKLFASASISTYEQAIHSYIRCLSELKSVSRSNESLLMEKSVIGLDESSLQSMQRFKIEVDRQCCNLDGTCSSRKDDNHISSNSNTSMSNEENALENFIEIDEIVKFSQIEMDQILSSSKSRINNEWEIIKILSHLKTFDSTITSVRPFGSVRFGFAGQRTNFNVSISAGNKLLLIN